MQKRKKYTTKPHTHTHTYHKNVDKIVKFSFYGRNINRKKPSSVERERERRDLYTS